jgi:hypothetical protein
MKIYKICRIKQDYLVNPVNPVNGKPIPLAVSLFRNERPTKESPEDAPDF